MDLAVTNLESQVRFLTLFIRTSCHLFAIATVFFCPEIFAQMESKSSEALQLQTRSLEPNSKFFVSKLSNPVIATVVALVFASLILVILWPNESQTNIYQRQRKYARIDGLFLKVSGYVLSLIESKQFLKESTGEQLPSFVSPRSPDSLYIVSLSCGGMSIETPYKIEKGQILRVNLHELPDFPSTQLSVYAKVVWSKKETKADEIEVWLCGAKFLLMNLQPQSLSIPPTLAQKLGSHESQNFDSEVIRKYINFMMDDFSV